LPQLLLLLLLLLLLYLLSEITSRRSNQPLREGYRGRQIILEVSMVDVQ